MMTTTRTTTITAGRPGKKAPTPRKSVEEKKAQAAALHESIARQVEALRDSDRWAAFLEFAAAFHAYSLNNVLLILGQRPDASHVAGFRKWQALGRQVRTGEKAIRIFGYATKTVTEDDANGESQEKRVARFPILSVFDIAQTDLIEGETDRRIVDDLTGADDHGIVDDLTAFLAAEGWTVSRHALTGGRNGYSSPEGRRVVIGTHLSAEHAAKTLIHETAHVLMGHVDDLTEYAEHRGLMETEAESVAYVVAGLVGFDTAAYSIGYVAGWVNADVEVIRGTAARVLATAHQIAAVLASEDEDPEDEDPADEDPEETTAA